jgi:hypothetical protein
LSSAANCGKKKVEDGGDERNEWIIFSSSQTMVPSLVGVLVEVWCGDGPIGRAQVQTMPSWQAVMRQSSRKMSAVSRSWETFLQTSGSSIGISSSRGQACVPINRSGSAQPVTSDGFVVHPVEEEVDEVDETDLKANELAALLDRSDVEFFPLPRLKFFR